MSDFAGYKKYSRTTAWALVLGYVGQILIAVAVGGVILSGAFSAMMVIGLFAVIVFIGTRLRALNNIIHECSHATFAEHRADNYAIGKFCAAMTFNSFLDYRDEHLSHHAHLGDYEHDLDLQRIKDLRLDEPLTSRVLMRHVFGPLLGRHLPYYLALNFSARDGKGWLALKIGILAAVVAFTIAFPLTGLICIVTPFALMFTALNYWADCLDHAGLVSAKDDLDASRNVLAPAPLRWLFFPRNDCYHLVHHLFPSVPARYLGETHEKLLRDGLYRSRSNAVRSRPTDDAVFHAAE